MIHTRFVPKHDKFEPNLVNLAKESSWEGDLLFIKMILSVWKMPMAESNEIVTPQEVSRFIVQLLTHPSD